jgi:hypothetical protein
VPYQIPDRFLIVLDQCFTSVWSRSNYGVKQPYSEEYVSEFELVAGVGSAPTTSSL